MKKYRVFAFICVACLFLFACAVTNQLQSAPKIILITATSGPAPAYPTNTEVTSATTLTPLPAQAYDMTQDARSTLDTRPRIEMVTETYTPINTPTYASQSSVTPLPPTRNPLLSPTTTSKPACRPEYPDFCINDSNNRNCKDWNNNGYYNFTVLQPDPLHYDKDFDGLGCEKP